MDKPRIFLGSSGKQEKLLQALARGLEDVACVEPWTTSFNPGTSTLERLLELTREVEFAAFILRRMTGRPAPLHPRRSHLRGRRRRGTMSCSKRDSSAGCWECAEHSFSMRRARSCPAIFLA